MKKTTLLFLMPMTIFISSLFAQMKATLGFGMEPSNYTNIDHNLGIFFRYIEGTDFLKELEDQLHIEAINHDVTIYTAVHNAPIQVYSLKTSC